MLLSPNREGVIMAGGIQARFGYPALTLQQLRRGQVGSLAITVVGLLATLGAAIAWGVNRGHNWGPKVALGAGLAVTVGGGIGMGIWHRRLDGPSLCRRELVHMQEYIWALNLPNRWEQVRVATARLVDLYRDVYRDEIRARIALLEDASPMLGVRFVFSWDVLRFFAAQAVDRITQGDQALGWLTPEIDDQGRSMSFAVAAAAWSQMTLQTSACLGRYNPEGRPRRDAAIEEVRVLEAVLRHPRVQGMRQGMLWSVRFAAARFVMIEAVTTQAIEMERAAELIVEWTQGYTPDQIRSMWRDARNDPMQHQDRDLDLVGRRQRRETLEAACVRRREEFRGTSAWPDAWHAAGRLDLWGI